MKPFKPKKKKCRNTECRGEFVAQRPMQVVCDGKCGAAYARQQREKKDAAERKQERRELRAAKVKVKPRPKLLKEVEAAFNAWIRERDYAEPCISCGRHHQGQWHAGHFRTVGGNPELRFEPLNVHKQCAPCNNHKSGDIVNYRLNLVVKIGAEKVAWLEGPHEAKHYSADDLEEMKRLYRALTRDLRKAREGGCAGAQA